MDKRLLVKIIIAISVSALLIGGIVAGIVLSRSPKKCIDGKSWSTTGKEPCTSCSTSCPTNKIVDKKCITTTDTTCKCEQGWEGIGCTGCISGSKACGPNGTCQEDGHCKCDEGWTGVKCDQCDRSTCVEGQCNPKPAPGKPHCTCNPGWKGVKCDQCTSDEGCIHGTCDTTKGTCTCHPGWEKSLSSGACDTCTYEGISNNIACNSVGICRDGKCQCPVDVNGDSLGWSGLECKVSNDEVSFPCIYGGTLRTRGPAGSSPKADPPPGCEEVGSCPFPCNTGERWRPYNQCDRKNNEGQGGWHCVNVTKDLPCRRNESQIWFQEGENCWDDHVKQPDLPKFGPAGAGQTDYNISPASIPGKLHGMCRPCPGCLPACESGLECVTTTKGGWNTDNRDGALCGADPSTAAPLACGLCRKKT